MTDRCVEERLNRLECENRRLRRAGAAIGMLVAAILLMGQAAGKRVITAEEFVLTDAEGKSIGKLGMTEAGGPDLVLYDRDGEVRLRLGLGKRDQPVLALYDAKGQYRISLGTLPTGEPSFGLFDAAGKQRIGLLAHGSEACFRIYGDAGQQRVAIDVGTVAKRVARLMFWPHDETDGKAAALLCSEKGDLSFVSANNWNDLVGIDLKTWQTLTFTAYHNNEGRLTSRVIKTGCTAYPRDSDSLVLIVGTETQPGWDVYEGKGQFSCSDREARAAYSEAAKQIIKDVRQHFPKIGDDEVQIEFFIRGSVVGTWQGGKMVLEGEE